MTKEPTNMNQHYQKTFSFENQADSSHSNREASRVATDTSLPPPPIAASNDDSNMRDVSSAAQAAYTFDDYKAFRSGMRSGSLSFSEYQNDFERLFQSREAIVESLQSRFNAQQLKNIAAGLGEWNARQNTKPQNAQSIYRKMIVAFVLDGTFSYFMDTTLEEAVALKVRAVTEDDFNLAREQDRQAEADYQRAIGDPQNLADFVKFIQAKGEDSLSDGQYARWDCLHADMTREERQQAIPDTVTSFESDELADYQFTIKEGYHAKRQCSLWIVQLSTRVERPTFNELNRKAKMLGGWYSSFVKVDAGFQFLEQDQATRFAALLTGDADRTDILAGRKERKEQSAAERLEELADRLVERATEALERSESSLQNTARRAGIQAGIRGKCYADQALARTLRSIAAALADGSATYLDGIRHKTHVETLDSVLYLAKWARIRGIEKSAGEVKYDYVLRIDEEQHKAISEADIRFVEYPFPSVYKRHLEEAVRFCQNAKGAKMSAARMAKRIRRESTEYFTMTGETDIERLTDFLGRAKSVGFDTERLDASMAHFGRLRRGNLFTLHELRSALREYLPHRAEARGDDPVRTAECDLLGKQLPGFFPTPRSVALEMLDLLELQNGQTLLEPSCGKGDLLDVLRETQVELQIHAIEQNWTLADVLTAKGYEVEFGDFLEHRGVYDRIVMNPPFEQSLDIEHVQHAFSQLAPGGRLVSVMSEGPFFRNDKKAIAFRHWLEQVEGSSQSLPEGAFAGKDAFRQTSVRTRLVIIDKPEA